jgi:hypothetical protein
MHHQKANYTTQQQSVKYWGGYFLEANCYDCDFVELGGGELLITFVSCYVFVLGAVTSQSYSLHLKTYMHTISEHYSSKILICNF